MELLYGGGMYARIGLDGGVREVRDAGVDDLLATVDRTEGLMPQETAG